MILKDKILITSGYNFEGYHIVDLANAPSELDSSVHSVQVLQIS